MSLLKPKQHRKHGPHAQPLTGRILPATSLRDTDGLSKKWSRRSLLTGAFQDSRLLEYLQLGSNNPKKSPLLLSAFNGHTFAVKYMLDNGYPVDHRDDNGRTSLHFACSEGHAVVVELLVQRGADRDLQDNFKKPPMHYALTLQRSEAVMSLVKTASTYGIFDSLNLPLGYAVRLSDQLPRDFSHLTQLVAVGLDLNSTFKAAPASDIFGTPYTGEYLVSALELALAAADLEMIRFLLRHGADPKGHGGRVVFHAMFGSILNQVIPKQPDKQLQVYYRRTNSLLNPFLVYDPWMELGNTTAQVKIKLLREMTGAFQDRSHLFSKDSNGRDALHHVASGNHAGSAELIEELIRQGFSLNEKDYQSMTALHIAVAAANKDAVFALIQAAGGDSHCIDATDALGRTALHVAAELKDADICRALRRAGAAVTVLDITGATPLIAAAKTNKTKTTGASCSYSLSQVGYDDEQGHAISYARELVDGTQVVLQKDSSGKDALRYAGENEDVLLAKFLVDHGAPISLIDWRDWTPPFKWPMGGPRLIGHGPGFEIPQFTVPAFFASLYFTRLQSWPSLETIKTLLSMHIHPGVKIGHGPETYKHKKKPSDGGHHTTRWPTSSQTSNPSTSSRESISQIRTFELHGRNILSVIMQYVSDASNTSVRQGQQQQRPRCTLEETIDLLTKYVESTASRIYAQQDPFNGSIDNKSHLVQYRYLQLLLKLSPDPRFLIIITELMRPYVWATLSEFPTRRPPLHLAAAHPNDVYLRGLLDAGFSIGNLDSKGRTALHIAARAGNLTNVQLLIDRGIDVLVCDQDGKTALGSIYNRHEHSIGTGARSARASGGDHDPGGYNELSNLLQETEEKVRHERQVRLEEALFKQRRAAAWRPERPSSPLRTCQWRYYDGGNWTNNTENGNNDSSNQGHSADNDNSANNDSYGDNCNGDDGGD
jgi:ankyrin repeat protein